MLARLRQTFNIGDDPIERRRQRLNAPADLLAGGAQFLGDEADALAAVAQSRPYLDNLKARGAHFR